MKKWKKPALWLLAILLLLAVFIAFILPGIVKSKAITGIEAATGRKATIARISLNPLTWTARVEGFRLMEKKEGVTFAAFSSVHISVSPKSIFRFAPIVGTARISSPYIHIVRTAANTYNFSDLLEAKKGQKENNGKTPRFSVNNITIDNGSIDFIDQALPAEKSHTLRRIELGVPFVSNISYLADRYVQPRFSAIINGSQLKLEGKLKPFVKGAETAFSVNLRDLSLPYYFSYYPGTPPAMMDSGRLSTSLDIIYRIAGGKNPELEMKGNIILADIATRDRSGAPLLSLVRGEARISRGEALARDFALSKLSADGPEIYLSRDKTGVWNFQRLIEGGNKETTPKPLINIAETTLTNGRLHVSDSLPATGFTTDLGEITFGMQGFSTAPGKKGTYNLAFASARGEKGAIKGEFSVDPLATETTMEFKEIALEAYYPYLAGELTAPVKGRLDAAAAISLSPADGIRLTKLDIETRQVTIPFGKNEGVKLAKAVLSGGRASLKERTLEVDAVDLQNGSIQLSRDAKGALSPLALLKETKKSKAPVKASKETTAPFRYKVKSVSGTGLNITFTDRMKEDSPSFNFKKLNFSLANIAGPKLLPIPFKIAAGYGNKGALSASGTVNPAPLKLKGNIALRRIPLTDFDSYLPDNLNITLADGTLDTKLAVNLAQAKGQMTGSFRGNIAVRSFYTLDADNEDLLKWESLQIDKLAGTLTPFSLDITDIALSKFYSRIVVNKNGTLNLQQLQTPPEKVETPGQAPPSPQKPLPAPPATLATPAPPAAQGKIQIGTVTIQDGTIVFIDHHTSPEYSSKMVNLGGRISGLSSAADKLADVDLRGNLENQSPLRITGQINPLRDNLFADLKVSFTDIELSPLTPYSGTFLGYTVEKGKLFLDLKYRIENKKLDSENKVFIDQFTFGKKVESDKATALPVRLAIALLKDRKGEIHLDIPVSGRTDDPQFSVWRIVLKILKNLLVKAATSPFALLQSVFGGKDDFSGVAFGPGSARITDAERAKLLKLGQVLMDRPALKLEVSGFVDREQDPEGYRNELLTKKIKSEKFLALVKEKKALEGQSADNVEISPQEYPALLKAVYRKEKFPKPRNFIGLVKDLPADEMKKLILTHTVVGDEALQGLARDRATVVRNFLITEGKLPPERIFEKKADIFKAPAKEGESTSRVEFGVAAQ
jgi:uncharacterized protein involved in outer membrane biogenesis